VRARELTIALLRCPQCGDSQWLRDGIPVARAVAFSALAEAFEGVPESARAQRAASATRTAARRELREAAQAPAPRRTCSAPCRAGRCSAHPARRLNGDEVGRFGQQENTATRRTPQHFPLHVLRPPPGGQPSTSRPRTSGPRSLVRAPCWR
jgi:hypothetical protein